MDARKNRVRPIKNGFPIKQARGPKKTLGMTGLVSMMKTGKSLADEYISLDELLPAAEEYGEHHVAIRELITGMMVMALSLLLFV